ncbi:T6SS phospholipase effector Tle1-like catalytic domain-containing protein [Tunturiibacter psychrotolerans]|uniref:T6SS phospholipase effector Tle1-like catalytic domain-containing protein n=1 Tax=Tunturiibacter psychrotolerans TaxID=3069686 RepID=UPI003D1F3EDD
MAQLLRAKSPKNVVICCDGTGNKYGGDNSNVVKLYTCLNVNAGQRCYYHPGVGTMGDPRHTSWVGRKVSMFGGLAFGIGFTDNMADAYRFLMDHCADGDHIYLFGFSRGAYTIRALAGALRVYGLLCKGNEGHLPYLLAMYSARSRDAFNKGDRKQIATDSLSDGFRETFSRTVPIHFMGLWDTVSSVGGLYDPVKLLYDGQNSIVRKARHAVSVDERRCFFQANLLGKPLGPPFTPVLTENYSNPNDQEQDIVQAWFPGVHSDVGGSYKQDESSPALEALRWILSDAEEDGLEINEEKRSAIFGESSPRYPGLAQMNRPPKGENRLHKSLTIKWALLEAFPHKYFDQDGKKRWRFTPWPHSREIPDGSLLHPSLRHRLAKIDYEPKNLDRNCIEDFKRLSALDYHTKVADKLEKGKYGVYRPDKRSPQKV